MTRQQTDAELKALYREGSSWGQDRLVQLERSRSIAWMAAAAATVVAVLAVIALVGMMPLKTVVPYTVLVDRQTGHVTTLDPSSTEKVGPRGALAKSMLVQYVSARETLDRSSVRTDYRKVVLWSGGAARASYLTLMKPGNPANPLATMPRTSLVQVRVKSASMLDDGSALVRYDLVRRDESGAEAAPAPFVSIIRYRFRDRPLTEADRFINPLGFEVQQYRRDPEVVPSVAVPSISVQAGPLQQPGPAYPASPQARQVRP